MPYPVRPGLRGGGQAGLAGEVNQRGAAVAQQLSQPPRLAVVGGQVEGGMNQPAGAAGCSWPTGRLRDDAIALMHNADAGRARMITLISVQLMDYFRGTGTSFAELRDTLRGPGQASGFEEIVARAVERGELPDVPRSSRVVNLPLDLLRHDTVMTMRAMPDESILEIVDEVWLPLLGGPGTSR